MSKCRQFGFVRHVVVAYAARVIAAPGDGEAPRGYVGQVEGEGGRRPICQVTGATSLMVADTVITSNTPSLLGEGSQIA